MASGKARSRGLNYSHFFTLIAYYSFSLSQDPSCGGPKQFQALSPGLHLPWFISAREAVFLLKGTHKL